MSDSVPLKGDSSSSRRKVTAGGVALLVGFSSMLMSTPAYAAPEDAVSLHPVIADCINDALGYEEGTPITEGLLSQLMGELVCVNTFGSMVDVSLDGLEFATNLGAVTLSGLNVTDISSLSAMSDLVSLVIMNSPGLVDLSPISNLNNLNYLDVSNTGVSSFDAVSGLNLEFVNANGLNVSNFAGLSGVRELSLQGVSSDNWESLAGLAPMSSLDLSGASSIDFSWLAGMDIQNLNLSFTNVSGLRFLEDVSGLSSLNLSFNSISNVESLSRLTNLTSLNLTSNSITDLSPLSGLNPGVVSAQNQYVVALAEIGSFANPVINIDGTVADFNSAEYDSESRTFEFTEPGVYSMGWSDTSGVFSGTLEVEVEDAAPLAAITGLNIIPDALTPTTKAALVFTAPEDAAEYHVTFTPLAGNGSEVISTNVPVSEALNGVIEVEGLTGLTSYGITISYTSISGKASPVSETYVYTTPDRDSVLEAAPGLNNVKAELLNDSSNTVRVTFDSVESTAVGTLGNGAVKLIVVQYQNPATAAEDEWSDLVIEADDYTDSVDVAGLPEGTYTFRVFYVTDTDAVSDYVDVTGIALGSISNGGNAGGGSSDAGGNNGSTDGSSNSSNAGSNAGGISSANSHSNSITSNNSASQKLNNTSSEPLGYNSGVILGLLAGAAIGSAGVIGVSIMRNRRKA